MTFYNIRTWNWHVSLNIQEPFVVAFLGQEQKISRHNTRSQDAFFPKTLSELLNLNAFFQSP